MHPPVVRALEDYQGSLAASGQMATSMLGGLTLDSLKASSPQSDQIPEVFGETGDSGSSLSLATL